MAIPPAPCRAPGHPQCSWALEQIMDELAEAIDMDPVELRVSNIPQPCSPRAVGTGFRVGTNFVPTLEWMWV